MSSTRRETTGTGSLSVAVIEAIAEHEGVDSLDLEQPLYEVIDPDALDTLFSSGTTTGRVIFQYDGYEVRVASDGDVRVSDPGG